MRKCPICDKEAKSPHHIKPRAEEGTDDPRNIIWLCHRCHDEYEGLVFNPDLLRRLRREVKGAKETANEEFWYALRDEGVVFIGIKTPGQPLVSYGIFFPYNSQFTYLEETVSAHQGERTKKKRGRPTLVLGYRAGEILDGNLTVREKAKLLNVGKSSISRWQKKKGGKRRRTIQPI